MYSKNWGYKEFSTDVEQTFHKIVAAHNYTISGSTDYVTYVNFKADNKTLYIAYEDSKATEFIFKTVNQNYHIETCCLIKNIPYKVPTCEFRDRECIQKGLAYIAEIINTHFKQELQGVFSYKEEYQLLEEELYFINKELAFLPLEDALKQKIKNIYVPNAGVTEMRARLIKEENYPKKFQNIFKKYLKTKQS